MRFSKSSTAASSQLHDAPLLQLARDVRDECEPSVNIFANELLAEAAVEQAFSIAASIPGTDSTEATEEVFRARAVALFEENAVYDNVRAGFWRWRAGQCQVVA